MTNQDLIEIAKEDIIRHEGYVREIYLDTEKLPTFGVGHLVTELDPEYTWPVGSPVTDERILQAFHDDFMVALKDAQELFDDFNSHSLTVQRVLVNMAFNLGRTRLGKFKNMIAAVNDKDYSRAADEMIDSRWYRQVGRRSKELVEMMKTANG